MSDRLSFHTAAGYCDYVDTVSVNSVCVAGCSIAGKINAQESGKWAATIKMWTSNLLVICPTLSLPHPWLCANRQLSANLLVFSSSSHAALGVNQFKRSAIILDLKIHEDDGSWAYETPLPPPLWMMHGRRGQQGCCQRPLYPAKEADHWKLENLKRPSGSGPISRHEPLVISTRATQDKGQSLLFTRTPGRGLPKLSPSHISLYKSWVAAMCGFLLLCGPGKWSLRTSSTPE